MNKKRKKCFLKILEKTFFNNLCSDVCRAIRLLTLTYFLQNGNSIGGDEKLQAFWAGLQGTRQVASLEQNALKLTLS